MDDADFVVRQQERQEQVLEQRRRRLCGTAASRSHCLECGDPIPDARRTAIPGVTLCVPCKAWSER
ncbi:MULTISPECIES: TraR/DksA C4-type zinc finger protein [Shewanella]|uniref:Conjugal transfer protein TraR n=1 Tax=Shewanella algae TaxID=38313 RepID=A0A7T8IP01_9GAMM|nr:MULTISPECIES: TraR/DksA C4-type zinc finger protein [Shewanella]MBO2683007.1 TraR/DksA C4-type zinc finger protein [Shewanella algae]MBO2695808.1 TraR/DksA C4-type zinc finger protein [Shewanella algae]NDO76160.1 conjugal transfer protein TraR [Shewanella sp. SE1]QQO83134.1 conjugal transfer protein TraR [Shewanella algae]HEW9976661.1 TraR/DksA C4-type zinc finger protein [Shewanella algae]